MDQTNDYRSYFFVAGIPPLTSAIIIFPLRFMEKARDARNDFGEQLCSEREGNISPLKDYSNDDNLTMLFESSV